MSLLRGKTLAIDASLLLRKVASCQPKKSLQEGHLALDSRIQQGLAAIINQLKYTYLPKDNLNR